VTVAQPHEGEQQDPALVELTQQELLDRVDRAQARVAWAGILAQATTDEQAQVARRVLTEQATVGALDGLTAGARLVEEVTAGRWVLMRQAREDGASWDQVGAAIGLPEDQARAWYAGKVDAHERHAAQWFDLARDRAVLDDPASQDSNVRTHDDVAQDGDDSTAAGW